MLNPVEIGIFKALDTRMYMGEIAERIKLAESTVSKYVNLSIQKGNGLFEKRRDGKKVYVVRSNAAHANLFLSIIREYPRWEIENLFSYAKMNVAVSAQKEKTADEIAYITGLTRQYVKRCLKELGRVGIIVKTGKEYALNPGDKIVRDFINAYYSYVNRNTVRDLSPDGIILWQRGKEFLFKTSKHVRSENIKETAVTCFHRYNIPLLTTVKYYFHTKRTLDVQDVILHTVLIEPMSRTYNVYACLLYQKTKPEDILKRAKMYDIEEHFSLIERYITTKRKTADFLPPWDEYWEIAKDYGVIK